jgi:hypothetical protein
MDWFRWWHGTVTDPKFKWVAKKSNSTVAEVIAIWGALLETASNVTQCNADVTQGNNDVTIRGSLGNFCCEDWDVHFDFDDGKTQKILSAMREKGLIKDNQLTNWNRRQSKREDPSTERVRAYRERQKLAKKNEKIANEGEECNADVTQGNAPEKIREEKNNNNYSLSNDSEMGICSQSSQFLPEQQQDEKIKIKKNEIPKCPHNEIIDLYHKILPMCPKVNTWGPERQKFLRARWREYPELQLWEQFFDIVSESMFLTGKARASPNGRVFVADLEWLVRPLNFAKVLDRKYHEQR